MNDTLHNRLRHHVTGAIERGEAQAIVEIPALHNGNPANAHLISAAPDLLEILKAAVARVQIANEEGDPILSAWLPDALSAIAKARGEA